MEQNFLVDQFFKGGPIMWPLLLCLLIALAIIIERLWRLLAVPGEEEAEQQLNEAEEVLSSQGEGGAIELFRQGSGVLNFIFAALVKRYDTLVLENRTDLEDMRQELILATEEAGEMYLGRLLNALGTIGVLSPLMGLLGTIMGMINAFDAIARAGAGDPAAVASGISEALITTAIGLTSSPSRPSSSTATSPAARKRSSRAWSCTATPLPIPCWCASRLASGRPARQKETLRCGRDERVDSAKASFKTSENPDLTPLINCMFLLLVFFMVATTFVNPKGLSVDLPGGEGESRATKDMNIVIDPDQTIQVNGEVTDKARLAEKIRQVIEADNTKNVILESARSIPHSYVVQVMDIARGEGIEAIAFAKSGEG